MKKLLSILLAFVLLLQTGFCTVYAESPREDGQTLTIAGSDLPVLAKEGATSAATIKLLNFPSFTVEVVSEDLQWVKPTALIVSGENVAVEEGLYMYRLTLRSDKTLTFDNQLKIYYQGINGNYSLHYEIDPTDNHLMVVTNLTRGRFFCQLFKKADKRTVPLSYFAQLISLKYLIINLDGVIIEQYERIETSPEI